MAEKKTAQINETGSGKRGGRRLFTFSEKILLCILAVVSIIGGGLVWYVSQGEMDPTLQCGTIVSDYQTDTADESVDETESVSMKIVVYGDTRTGHDVHKKVTNMILEENPDAVFHTGDLVNDGLDAGDWEMWDEITSELLESTDFYPAIGNHEKNAEAYYDRFELPNNERWYVVKYDNLHVFVLDTDKDITAETDQYAWLEVELAKSAEEVDGIIAVFHHPPYSTGPHEVDEASLRDSVVPLFEQYGVDMVFSGHDHDYERSYINEIYYIVAGGGGAPTYDQQREEEWSQVFLNIHHYCVLIVNEDTIEMTVYGLDGEVLDEVAVDVRD